VGEPHRGRAVTNGRGDPLDRTVPGVAGREHPRHGRLERERGAVERPARRIRVVPHDVAAGQDVAALDLNRPGQPARPRLAADQHEQRGGRDLPGPVVPPVIQRERLEVLTAVAVGDLGVQAHRDVRRGLDLPDQVGRHRPGQGVAPHQHGHLPGVPGQVQRGLSGRVPRAHDEHVAIFHGPRLGPGRAVENAGPDQRLQPRHGQPAPGDAGRDDDRLSRDLVAVGQAHDARLAALLQPGRGLGEHHVRAEDPGLLAGPAGELVPADPVREAGVIADHRAVAGLAAGNGLLQYDRLEPLGRGVDGGGQAGRSRPDDGHVTLVDVAARAAAG
jgi:hypothetical protein